MYSIINLDTLEIIEFPAREAFLFDSIEEEIYIVWELVPTDHDPRRDWAANGEFRADYHGEIYIVRRISKYNIEVVRA